VRRQEHATSCENKIESFRIAIGIWHEIVIIIITGDP
jgi:hypothetical protein